MMDANAKLNWLKADLEAVKKDLEAIINYLNAKEKKYKEAEAEQKAIYLTTAYHSEPRWDF